MINCLKICTGITTFHRNHFLKGLLRELEISEYITKSIIFDNSSSSETNDIVNEYDKTLYLSSGNNEGPAGAVYTILEKSLEIEWDYFWILDDDMIIDNKKVKVLLDWFNIIEDNKIGAVSPPLFTCIDGKVVTTHPREEKPTKVKMTNWSGLLIKREVIQIGVRPDPSLFFGWEDSDFTLSITKLFSIFNVPYPALEIPSETQSLIDYCDSSKNNYFFWRRNRLNQMPGWKTYYYIRNTLIIGISKHKIGILYFIRYLLSSTITLDKNQIKYTLKGIHDGVLRKTGRTLDPIIFYEK